MTQETPILEPDELEALLGQVNTRTPTGARNYAMLQLMAQAGIRCGEALQVKAADIRQETWATNGDTVKVWVLRLPRRTTKGKQGRSGIPLSVAVRQALDHWQDKRAALGITGGPLFCTISTGRRQSGFAVGDGELVPGKPLNSRYVRELVGRLAKKAGIGRRVHPHMLRHTALTGVYDRTRDLRMTQDVAGHSTARMTERYTHVHDIDLARAMGAIDDEQPAPAPDLAAAFTRVLGDMLTPEQVQEIVASLKERGE